MARETESLELDSETVRAGVEAVLRDPGKGSYLLACREESVVASLLILPEWSDWRNQTVLWIHSVYVIPECRGQKIFRGMYRHLREKVGGDPSLAGLRLYVDKRNLHAAKVYLALEMSREHYDLFEWLAS
jgi:GNAT superfamily N-acetyltransferase